MEFNSTIFLFFLMPIAFAGYFALVSCKRLKNVWLLIISLIFYAWGEPAYVLILLGCIVVNYFFGLAIHGLRKA